MAAAVRHYLASLSTNFAFNHAIFDLKSHDPAIDAIRNQLWLIYDDLREHRHEEGWRISEQERDVVLRVIMFLKGDFEYQWPRVPSWYSVGRPFIGLITLGFGTKMLDGRFWNQDYKDIWPFHDRDEVELARDAAKYLASATRDD